MPELPRLPTTNPMDALLPAPNTGLAVAFNLDVDELSPAPLSTTGTIVLGVVGLFVVLGIILLIAADDVSDALGN